MTATRDPKLRCMQDAAVEHNAALAEDDTAPLGSGTARAGAPKGLLPNLKYGSGGLAELSKHVRWVPLPDPPQLDAAVRIDDASLPSLPLRRIPQRTPVWFAARALCVTASKGADFLGLLAPPAARTLAAANLKVQVGSGSAALPEVCRALLAARAGNPLPPSPPANLYAAYCMAMGTNKEPDVLLTYNKYLDTLSM